MFVSDIEDFVRMDQLDGMVVGRSTIMRLGYTDDLALLTKTEKGMKSIIKRFVEYLKRKQLMLYAEKTKTTAFRKGGREKNVK